jgi:hypothetical protein
MTALTASTTLTASTWLTASSSMASAHVIDTKGRRP